MQPRRVMAPPPAARCASLRRPPPLRLPLLLVLVLLAVGGRLVGAYEKHLFLNESQVEELGAADLDGVKEERKPYAVMFYSPTCPHCTHFAPTWKEVAAGMAGTGIHIAAVSCLAESKVCQREQIHGYPTLKAFGLQDPAAVAAGKPDEGVVIKDQTKEKILAWLKNHYRSHFSSASGVVVEAGGSDDGKGVSAAGEGPEGKEGKKSKEGSGTSSLSLAELRRRRAADAFTSLRFAMDHDVFLGSTELKEGALESLKDLLRALALLFPGADRRQAFSGLLGAIEPLDKMGIAEWEEQVEQHMAPLLPKDGDYHWTLARPDAGYTGGLWMLFHILTARSAAASADDQDPRVQPQFVLGVIHSFVEHFFGCEECKGHFLKAYEEVRATWEPQGAKGAVLWIWDLHDKVNVRLDKPRWPSRKGCPRCWKDQTPQPDALYKKLVESYDIRDGHVKNASPAAGAAAGEGTGLEAAAAAEEEGEGGSEGQIVALSHDYFFIGLLALIVLGAAAWKIERKLSMGRRKKRSEGQLPLYEEVEVVDRV